jgi:PAS domain S-box-containing protein
MGLIPLTWAYAITRYRLMDVDIIFQQGYVYTLATLAVIGTFYGLIFLLFNAQNIPTQAIVVLICFATFVFQPIRRWIQELLDRHVFYRDRYDSRRTLIEFARELSSETNRTAMLAKVSDRLLRTLSIQQVGCFLLDEASGRFHLHSLTARSGKQPKSVQGELDLSFLTDSVGKPYIFFERPRNLRDIISQEMPEAVRDTIAQLDFTYYVNCQSRGRTLAFLGISRTTEGDFLSSDDIELLVTVSNYVAIAIENSNLYSSLQRKADEYERLKEFSENIVESINVGILAVNLEDRVESWNTQIERLTGISRADAIGKTLIELFPSDLSQRFDELRSEDGVHNVYKAPLNSSIVNIAIAPLVSKEMTQIGRLIIFDDVTDRDELERRLVQADKLSSIGLLAAGVAHEVNTPLAVISTYAQMLAKQVSDDREADVPRQRNRQLAAELLPDVAYGVR